jgi:hypothetical protein
MTHAFCVLSAANAAPDAAPISSTAEAELKSLVLNDIALELLSTNVLLTQSPTPPPEGLAEAAWPPFAKEPANEKPLTINESKERAKRSVRQNSEQTFDIM